MNHKTNRPRRTASWSGSLASFNDEYQKRARGRNEEFMKRLEKQYIRSLQQQIYLLELENKYIRHKAAELTDVQSQITSEASTSATNIKDIKNQMKGLETELYRKDSHANLLHGKYKQQDNKMRELLTNRDSEKDDLLNQLIQMRGEREIALRTVAQKDVHINDLKLDVSRYRSNLDAAETQLEILRDKLQAETKRAGQLQKELMETRANMSQMNTELNQLRVAHQQKSRQFETVIVEDDLQGKLDHLQNQLSDAFLDTEKQRFTQERHVSQMAILTDENRQLKAEVFELQRKLERQCEALNRLRAEYDQMMAHSTRDRLYNDPLLSANMRLRGDMADQENRRKQFSAGVSRARQQRKDRTNPKVIPLVPATTLHNSTEMSDIERRNMMEKIRELEHQVASQQIQIGHLERFR